MRDPIIIGIDPGTTSGYAVLDIHGKLLDKGSSKELGLSDLIKIVIKYGIPIIVGTDKAKIPGFVEQFAAKTGSKIVFSETDLKVEEKRALTKEYIYKDSHEMDSLASALYAFNSYSNLISRIKKYIEETKKHYLFNQLLIYVIKEDISIKDAVQIIETKDEETTIVKKAVEEQKLEEKDFLRLYKQLKTLEKDKLFLINKCNNLESALKKTQQSFSSLEKLHLNKKRNEFKKVDILFSFKEKRLNDLTVELEQEKKKGVDLKKELMRAKEFVANASSCYILKKLRNLAAKEYDEKKHSLIIKEGDILLIENPNVYNKETINELAKEIIYIVYKTNPNRQIIGESRFEFISATDLDIAEFDEFALVTKKSFDKRLNKKNTLHKLIEEYQENR